MASRRQQKPTSGNGGAAANGPRVTRLRLGQILEDEGEITPQDTLRILAVQNRVEARFGDILLARGMIDRDRLYDAVARQFRAPVARFDRHPPDVRLIDSYGVTRCLSEGLLPWRKTAGYTIVATARPEEFETRRPDLERQFGPVQLAITGEVELHRAVLGHHRKVLATRAESRVAPMESCRRWHSKMLREVFLALGIALLVAMVTLPDLFLVTLFAWVFLSLVANTALKLAVAASHVIALRRPAAAAEGSPPVIARLPPVSILVPLYQEREIAGRLIKRLDRIDYPRELLDICLVVEADDAVTCDTIDRADLPRHMRQIVVPNGQIKTKPRALNYALDFCRGGIVGVYDAEDAPAPDQIMKVVQRFHERPPEVACLQGVLDYYNARTNWLSRCFTAEYAMWFRVMLPGLTRLGLAIPLGGTSLFFRRQVLEDLGGWDAHNVTEDADLGIRLARRGYRTEMIDSVTEEEANCRFWPWVKQRSRWLKGYAMTWAVHMRQPGKLRRELGWWRFAGVQLLFLGTITQFLFAPLLWSFWILPFGLPHPVADLLGAPLLSAVIAAFLISLLADLVIGLLAVRGERHRFLIPWLPTLYFYFPMAALATYKGLAELFTRPFYWDKTEHGIFDEGPESDAGDAPDAQADEPDAETPPADRFAAE